MRQETIVNVYFLVVISWTLGAEASDPVPTQAGSRNIQHSLLKKESPFFFRFSSPHGPLYTRIPPLISIIEFDLWTADAEKFVRVQFLFNISGKYRIVFYGAKIIILSHRKGSKF
jgi:hypothetical protein